MRAPSSRRAGAAIVVVLLVALVRLVGLPTAGAAPAARLRLATYNVENYLLAPAEGREPKPEPARAKVAEMVALANADVIAFQELGGTDALEDLRGRVHRLGLDYPHAVVLHGADTNIQVGLLSRFPFVAVRLHTNDVYLLGGRRFHVSRGILEAELLPAPDYRLVLFTTHLKSRRAVPEAAEAEMRLAEARILREKIDARLRESPDANLAVLGDFNDTKDTAPIRALLGRGRDALIDTRPSEANGDTGFTPNPRWEPRTVTWTHYYGKEDSYSRVDYILLHPRTAREWVPAESRLIAAPDWGRASDHRPVTIVLEPRDR